MRNHNFMSMDSKNICTIATMDSMILLIIKLKLVSQVSKRNSPLTLMGLWDMETTLKLEIKRLRLSSLTTSISRFWERRPTRWPHQKVWLPLSEMCSKSQQPHLPKTISWDMEIKLGSKPEPMERMYIFGYAVVPSEFSHHSNEKL